jgi:hypothetical protein
MCEISLEPSKKDQSSACIQQGKNGLTYSCEEYKHDSREYE